MGSKSLGAERVTTVITVALIVVPRAFAIRCEPDIHAPLVFIAVVWLVRWSGGTLSTSVPIGIVVGRAVVPCPW